MAPNLRFCSSLVSALCVGIALASAGDKVAATVNGVSISVAEVDAGLAQSPPSAMPLTVAQKRQLRQEMVSVLIDDQLVRQFLRTNGAKIEPREIDRQFAALVASPMAGGKTIEGYLKDLGLTEVQVRENFRMMLQLAKYLEARSSDEKLRQYHAANREFFDKTTVRTSHIVIRVGSTAPAAERAKARTKLQALRADIVAGKTDFAGAAKANSQCPSGPMGGDLGFACRKFQVDEAYAKAAFALNVGEISDVVESDIGFHLILATERKAGAKSKFEDIAPDVRECYEAEIRQSLLANLRKKAKIEIVGP